MVEISQEDFEYWNSRGLLDAAVKDICRLEETEIVKTMIRTIDKCVRKNNYRYWKTLGDTPKERVNQHIRNITFCKRG